MVAHFAGVALLLIIHELPLPAPFFLEVVKKKKKIKQPDVSPVSSVIHKTPSTPHSSLMLYEKLKLNQGSVIKLSDFCWIRMNSCECHIVCWKCAWGASGLRMHIHRLLVEMDLLTMGHLRFPSPGTPAFCAEPSCLQPWILPSPPILKRRKGRHSTKARKHGSRCHVPALMVFQRTVGGHPSRGPGRSGLAVIKSEKAMFRGFCGTELLIPVFSLETFRNTELACSLAYPR